VKYIVYIGLVLLALVGCDGGDVSTLDSNSSSENSKNCQDINPNFDIYDNNCHQSEDSALCGFAGGGKSGEPPRLPSQIQECEDKECCL